MTTSDLKQKGKVKDGKGKKRGEIGKGREGDEVTRKES